MNKMLNAGDFVLTTYATVGLMIVTAIYAGNGTRAVSTGHDVPMTAFLMESDIVGCVWTVVS